jgi:hypothetical protein
MLQDFFSVYIPPTFIFANLKANIEARLSKTEFVNKYFPEFI